MKKNVDVKPVKDIVNENPAEAGIPAQAKQIEELQRQLTECTNRWKRALADYQNLEKRVNDERQMFARFAAKNIIIKLLTIVDDLEKAQIHLKDQGLGLTLKKLHDLLKEEGVAKIEVAGKDFDVHTMEAVVIEEGKADNQVLEELRAGYKMYGAVLRPAQVKVSKNQ